MFFEQIHAFGRFRPAAICFAAAHYRRSGPAPGWTYSIDTLARVVIAYLGDRSRGPVHLFGNSMGGSICLAVASERPDLVRTLTLISPAVPDLRLHRPGTDCEPQLYTSTVHERATDGAAADSSGKHDSGL